jgi:hypothetical protein
MGIDHRLDELEQLCHDVEPIGPWLSLVATALGRPSRVTARVS